MIHDQLHRFSTEAERNAAFPRPLDEQGQPTAAPCWLVNGATIMPVQILVQDGETIRASTDFWVGVATTDPDPWWAMPSCAVELARPDEPTPWLACVTRSRLAPEQAGPVRGVSPVFAGSAYVFPA